MSLRTEVDVGKSLERAEKLLAGIEGGVIKATWGALKRAGNTAKTQAGRFAAEEYTIRKSEFMANVSVSAKHDTQPGTKGREIASMSVRFAGNVLPLLTFNTKYSRDGRLTTQVKRNGGEATLQNAFVAQINGRKAVYERVEAARFPVEQKFGPSTAHMMQNERVIEKMDETMRETYEKRMEHEITRILNGW